MSTEPDQDENKDGNPEGGMAPVVEQKKMPARLKLLYLVVLIMMGLAITGLIMAITGRAVDPETIKPPTHTESEISKLTPFVIAPLEPQQTIAPIDDIAPEAPIKKIMPEIQQKDTPLKMDPSALLHKENQTAPQQSMIVWDEPSVKPVKGARPQIVIVIDDMGLNMRNSREMANLKYPTTLAYMPYAQNLSQQTKQAYDNGHELIVHMPMEPQDIAHNNPGPDALLTTVSAEENRARLTRSLGKFDNYIIGLNNHMGSKMTADEKAMRPVMQVVKDKGLWFLDSRTIGNSVAGKLASEFNVPYVARDIFLDNTETVPAVMAQLRVLEQVAKKRGYVVAIGHPYNCTVAALKEWMPNAKAKGFDIVPLSTIIAQRFPSAAVPKYARLKRSDIPAKHVVAVK